jgi:4-coumarate--CoA ligase (photoactive yellow protein activation family)
MTLLAPPPEVAAPSCIAADTIRRLCISLIAAEHADLVAKGQMHRDAVLPLLNPHVSLTERDALRIDEDGLGFDSLARLGLILRVNRFFNLADSGVEDYLLIHRTLGDWVALISRHFQIVGDLASFTFDTSGSAGPVKHVSHPATVLIAEMKAHVSGPLSYQASRVLSLVPPHHIYGFLFTCLLPDLLGLPVLDLTRLGPTAVFRQAKPGDLIIGTPFNWQVLHATGLTLPPEVTGITSAGPSTPATWEVLTVNGLARLTEVYGSTETGGIGTRTEFGAAFDVLPHLARQNDAILRRDDGQSLALQDHLDWVEPGRFQVQGRKDDVVQVGGVNVSPAQVATVIRGMNGVADVAVRLGSGRLRAFIVPSVPDVAALEHRLRDQIAQSLPAPARPTSLCFGSALPRTAMGKLCDWPEAAQHG